MLRKTWVCWLTIDGTIGVAEFNPNTKLALDSIAHLECTHWLTCRDPLDAVKMARERFVEMFETEEWIWIQMDIS